MSRLAAGRIATGLIFVSYSAVDAAIARSLVERIVAEGFAQVYLSTQPERGVAPGEQWEPNLYEHLRRASAVVFLLTPAARRSKWCFTELAFARALGKPILTVATLPGLQHPLTASEQTLELDFAGDACVRTDRLMKWLRERIDLSDLPWPEGDCPYPGMNSFGADFEPVFFGRDDDIRDILDVFTPLRRSAGVRRVVAITGPSGSGKSSLAIAGIAPRLGRRPGWTVLPPCAPGPDPLRSLASAIGDAASDLEPSAMADRLLEGLTRRAGTGTGQQLVVLIDQFEEILTESVTDKRREFLDLLHRLATGDSPVWVLATVRVEFVSRTAGPNRVNEFLGAGGMTRLLLPLGGDGDSIRRVVEVPAAKAGATVERRLLDRIISDVVAGDRTGASLPLLAFALRETWIRMEERRRSRPEPRELTLDDYLLTGGVDGVITQQAREASDRLALLGLRDEVLPTLSRFVVPTDFSEQPVRRRVPLWEMPDFAEEIAREFERRRLLRVVEVDGAPAFDITHEAVFQAWGEFRDYLEEHRQEIQDLAQVAGLAHAWDRGGRSADEILRGPLLIRVLGTRQIPEDPVVADYLDASIHADRESQLALLARRAQQAADEALDVLAAKPMEALAKLCRAATVCRDEGAEPPLRLQDALYQALCVARQQRCELGHSGAVRAVAAAPSGLVATGGDDGLIRLWNPDPGLDGSLDQGHSAGILALAFSTDETLLASTGEDSRVILWPLSGEGHRKVIDIAPDVPSAVALSPRDTHLAAVTEAGILRVYRPSDLRLVAELAAHSAFATACVFDPRGEFVYTAGADGTIAAWNLATLEEHGRVEAHDGPAFCLAISPDGSRLASGGIDGAIRLWDRDLEAVGRLDGHRRLVATVAFSRGGRSVVSAGFDGFVRQWELTGHSAESPMVGHVETVCSLAVVPGSGVIVSGGADRTVRWWTSHGRLLADPIGGMDGPITVVLSLPDGRVLAACDEKIWCFTQDGEIVGAPWEGHESYVWALAACPASDAVASASADGTVRLWDVEGRLLAPPLDGHKHDVQDVAFSPDGGRIVSAGLDGTVRLWNRQAKCLNDRLGWHGSQVNIVGFIPAEREPLVLSGGNDGMLCVWTLSGTLRRRQRAHTGPVRHAALTGDGTGILSVSNRGDVRSWTLELEAGSTITAHGGPISMVVTHPHGMVFTSGFDGTVRRWTAQLEPFGEPILAHPGGAWAIDIDRSGDCVVTGGEDAIVRTWRAGEWRSWLAEAEARSRRESPG